MKTLKNGPMIPNSCPKYLCLLYIFFLPKNLALWTDVSLLLLTTYLFGREMRKKSQSKPKEELELNCLSLHQPNSKGTAPAAAKLLQSCLTLCDPINGSPSGSLFPGILQARILEWVAISSSNA